MKTVNTFQMLKAMLLVAGKRDIRYYLNGVHIKRDGARVVVTATDGHSLLQVCLDGCEAGVITVADSADVIICRDAAERVLRMSTKKTPPEVAVMADGMVFFNNAQVDTVEGRFPDVSRVLRTRTERTQSGDPQGVRLDLLTRVSKAFGMLADCAQCTMHASDGYKMHRETSAGSITALVMPARL